MKKAASTSTGGTTWIDRAIRDVERLHREITTPRKKSSEKAGEPLSDIEEHRRLAAACESLEMLTRAITAAGVSIPAPGWLPPVEIRETGEEIEATFELAGVPRSTIRVQAEEEILFISGARPAPAAPGDSIRFSERTHGPFTRSLRLPHPVEAKSASAIYRDGCLTVRLPKQTVHRPARS